MSPINDTITENATVQKILESSQSVTRALNQHYTFVTFDLLAAKKAYSIV
jgi:hypothetical protein